MAQEVFLAAYREMLRAASPFLCPGAWLIRVAVRRASNYRRGRGAARFVVLDAREVEERLPSVESAERQIASGQLLALLLDEIDEEARAVVLAHSAEGETWEEIARAQGLSIAQARHLHGKAIAAMEAALTRTRLGEARRRARLVPLPLAALFQASHADAEAGLSAAEEQRRWEALARRLDDVLALSRSRAPSSLRSALTFLLGGAAGLVVGLLIRDRSAQALVPSSSPPPPPSAEEVVGSAEAPVLLLVSSAAPASASLAPRVRVESVPRSAGDAGDAVDRDYAKLEQARVALAAGEAAKALGVLQGCACGALAEVRRGLWAKACAAPETRGLPACVANP